jgi:hypothetical protein
MVGEFVADNRWCRNRYFTPASPLRDRRDTHRLEFSSSCATRTEGERWCNGLSTRQTLQQDCAEGLMELLGADRVHLAHECGDPVSLLQSRRGCDRTRHLARDRYRWLLKALGAIGVVSWTTRRASRHASMSASSHSSRSRMVTILTTGSESGSSSRTIRYPHARTVGGNLVSSSACSTSRQPIRQRGHKPSA